MIAGQLKIISKGGKSSVANSNGINDNTQDHLKVIPQYEKYYLPKNLLFFFGLSYQPELIFSFSIATLANSPQLTSDYDMTEKKNLLGMQPQATTSDLWMFIFNGP